MAAKIIEKFNTWAFKRAQPGRPALLHRLVTRQVSAGRSINFILYWGKGPRNDPEAPDLQCLDFLASFATRIATAHAPGARITLCLTDTHARLNGHSPERIERYFSAIEQLARQRGMAAVRLSGVVANYAPTSPPPAPDDPALLDTLERSAGRWYRGLETAREGARQYLAMNMVEKVAVERFAPDSIFVTFNGSELSALFPDNLPIFFMYSLKRGTAVKPWFLDADGHPYEASR
ncbi:MAG: hypothetical protein R3D27_05160 [Hyphomicrobiaceae bacterium]